MKKYAIDQLRNVALVSHGGAGKTTLAEAMLFRSGAINRMGRIEEGTTVTDHDPEEVKRQISLNTSLAPLEWAGHKINLIDTPGYFDFVGEVKSGLRVADAALILVDAVSGIEVGTSKVMAYAGDIPKMVFVNKMDRENANFDKVLSSLRDAFGNRVIPVQCPIGAAESFKGVVDLVTGKAFLTEGGKSREGTVPDDLSGEIARYRDMFTEEVASADDELMMKFLEGEALTEEEVARGLAIGTRNGQIIPVLCGSAAKLTAVGELMDAIIHTLPSPDQRPEPKAVNPKTGQEMTVPLTDTSSLAALVFKTMADPFVGKLTLFRVYSGAFKSDSHVFNAGKGKEERVGQLFMIRGKEQQPVPEVPAGDIGAVAKLADVQTGDTLADKDKPVVFSGITFPRPQISLAVEPKAKGDEDKIGTGLAKLTEEDPTFTVGKSAETGQLLISGQGELHLEVITSRLAKKFGVGVELTTPRIPYKETIKSSVKVEGKHKKQSGGRGQFGHCWLEIEPLPSGGGFEFVDKIFGGSVPRQYIPAVEKGVRETMEEGVLAGYPVVDIKVSLTDGSYHSVDSSEMAFKIAASMGFKKGFMDAKPVLLEPIMRVEVTVPEEYMGDIIGDLNKKRGKILGMEPGDGVQVIRALAPHAEMFRYAVDLRSMTQGRGSFSMEFDHYEELPSHLAEQVVAAAKKDREKED